MDGMSRAVKTSQEAGQTAEFSALADVTEDADLHPEETGRVGRAIGFGGGVAAGVMMKKRPPADSTADGRIPDSPPQGCAVQRWRVYVTEVAGRDPTKNARRQQANGRTSGRWHVEFPITCRVHDNQRAGRDPNVFANVLLPI